jgi:hypothetical protein
MPDEFERDLARRLRAYESRVPDADAPNLGPGARAYRSMPRRGGVLVAVAAGGLAAVLLLNLPWGNVGDQTPLPSPTATPEGIVQLSLDDPRRDCFGGPRQLLAVYQIPDGEAFWTLFPGSGLAPEIRGADTPLLVVVYDGIYPGATFGGLRPTASGEPVPSPRTAPAPGTVDLCVETVNGSGNPIGVYSDIPLMGSLVANAVASGAPEPTSVPSPPPVSPLTASNGTAGVPVSWCWDGACVHGSLDFEDLSRYPGVGTYFSVQSDRAITRLEATVYTAAGEGQQLEVNNNEILVFAPEPRIVLVHAKFEGGEVSYAWRIARQVIVGVGDDHVAISELLVEVTPPRMPDDAMIHLAYTDPEMLGIEGAAQFLKATTPQGTVVLDRIVSQDGDQERLPAGEYVLTAYYRTCDGSCNVLDPPHSFCSVDAVLEPNDTLQLVVNIGGRSCEASQGD